MADNGDTSRRGDMLVAAVGLAIGLGIVAIALDLLIRRPEATP